MSYNHSDDDLEEGIVLGTPFPPLETNEIVSKKPDLDLTVRDSKGRRRFHGAFTGGFSAGHYMTVGSEEGFTPQQYKSNRQQKWDQSLVQRKPENFMDSEDLDVFGIAPKRITTKEKFAEQEFAGFRKTDSLIDVLKSVIKPTVESIGIKLYKRMKRLAKSETKYNEPKQYGCEVPTNTSANNDFSIVLYKPKSDLHGIGYKSIAEENNLESKDSSGVSAVFKSGRKLMISGEAFGYGVLDEDNEDEAVIYQKDDMTQYDSEIGFLRPEQRRIKDKPKDILKSDVIEGFVKCSTKINLMEIIAKKYPKPVLPKEWRKRSTEHKSRKSRWDHNRDGQEMAASSGSGISDDKTAPKTPVLNANIRAVLLGEEVIHRRGIKKPELEVKTNTSLDPKSSSLNKDKDNQSLDNKKNTSNLFTPLTGFWANKFTRSSDGPEESAVSGGLSEIKVNKSVKSDENVTKNDEKNKATERTTYEWHPHHLLCKRFNIPNPFPQYPDFVGVVTVGQSDVRNRTSKISDKKVKPNVFQCLINETVFSNSEPLMRSEENKSIAESVSKSDENNTKNNETNEELDDESETTTRPPMDLFKAIFASDEESDGEEDTEVNKTDSTLTNETNVLTSDETPDQLKSDDKRVNGIFANIDFDELNRDFTPVLKSSETTNSVTDKSEPKDNTIETNINVKQSQQNDDFYGPALPPNPSLYTSSDTTFQSLDQTTSRSSKRKKKDKKHKKQKHKKEKTSHSKHKRHRKASTSSSSSPDIDSKILDKIRNVRK